MISNEDANNFKGYFLTKDYPLSELKSRQTAIPSYSDYWNVKIVKIRVYNL